MSRRHKSYDGSLRRDTFEFNFEHIMTQIGNEKTSE